MIQIKRNLLANSIKIAMVMILVLNVFTFANASENVVSESINSLKS